VLLFSSLEELMNRRLDDVRARLPRPGGSPRPSVVAWDPDPGLVYVAAVAAIELASHGTAAAWSGAVLGLDFVAWWPFRLRVPCHALMRRVGWRR
jgi:hypothetical protein